MAGELAVGDVGSQFFSQALLFYFSVEKAYLGLGEVEAFLIPVKSYLHLLFLKGLKEETRVGETEFVGVRWHQQHQH